MRTFQPEWSWMPRRRSQLALHGRDLLLGLQLWVWLRYAQMSSSLSTLQPSWSWPKYSRSAPIGMTRATPRCWLWLTRWPAPWWSSWSSWWSSGAPWRCTKPGPARTNLWLWPSLSSSLNGWVEESVVQFSSDKLYPQVIFTLLASFYFLLLLLFPENGVLNQNTKEVFDDMWILWGLQKRHPVITQSNPDPWIIYYKLYYKCIHISRVFFSTKSSDYNER